MPLIHQILKKQMKNCLETKYKYMNLEMLIVVGDFKKIIALE